MIDYFRLSILFLLHFCAYFVYEFDSHNNTLIIIIIVIIFTPYDKKIITIIIMNKTLARRDKKIEKAYKRKLLLNAIRVTIRLCCMLQTDAVCVHCRCIVIATAVLD